MRGALFMLAVVVVLAGCGTSDDRRQARDVVDRFYDAIRHDRGDEACAELSSATVEQLESQKRQSCSEAVTQLTYAGGAIVGARVYITNAKVDLRNGESAFLSREPAGWKLTAIGCRPEKGKPRDRPFECQAEA